jgi:antitoxin component of RelBE/YafQ-DinJ toxin-antitoxin module
MAKEITFKMRLDEKDKARLDALAEHYSVPVASVIRILTKREADALGLPKPAKRKAVGK